MRTPPPRPAPMLITGLPGVRDGRLWSAVLDSLTALVDGLQHHRCVSAFGLFGSITVYRDDNLCYRCLFHAAGNCLPMSSEIYAHRNTQVRDWLKIWLPQLHTDPKRRKAA